jgi:hypothetical protein
MMMRKIVLILASLIAFNAQLGTVQAQTPANAPTNEQMSLGREIVLTSGISRSFDAIIPQFAEQVRQSLVTRPEIKKDLDEVLDGMKETFDSQRTDMVDRAASIYARTMSVGELKDVSVFFKSPAGKKYVESQPVVLDQLFNEMQAWSQRASEVVWTQVRDEMKKRGHTL